MKTHYYTINDAPPPPLPEPGPSFGDGNGDGPFPFLAVYLLVAAFVGIVAWVWCAIL